MTVRREMPYKEGTYFITFTCYERMPLIGLADAYDAVYHQFDILKLEGHYVLGFVIMPNHIHALLGMRDKGESINKHIGTLKRFLAYALVQRLQESEKTDVLEELSRGVPATDRNCGKLHQVFEPSFDSLQGFGTNWCNAVVKDANILDGFPNLAGYRMILFYLALCTSISISINCPTKASPFTSSQVPVGNCFL